MRIFVFLFCVLLLACRSSHRDGAGASGHSPDTASTAGTPGIPGASPRDPARAGQVSVPPGHCRIAGSIVRIDSITSRGEDNSPCAKAPCRALVRIDSIYGYGPAFPGEIAEGSTIPITFSFSLSPTRDILPNLKTSFPGLRVGDSFKADMSARQGIAASGDGPVRYSIEGYELLRSHNNEKHPDDHEHSDDSDNR